MRVKAHGYSYVNDHSGAESNSKSKDEREFQVDNITMMVS